MDRLARPEGLEPPAYWFEANRSIRLSYGRGSGDRDLMVSPRATIRDAYGLQDALVVMARRETRQMLRARIEQSVPRLPGESAGF